VLPVSATSGSRVALGEADGIVVGGPGQELNKLSLNLLFDSLAVDKGSPLSYAGGGRRALPDLPQLMRSDPPRRSIKAASATCSSFLLLQVLLV
jgi:hypothetical protein